MPAGWAIQLSGFSRLMSAFQAAQEWADRQGDHWWVGTVVHYAPYLEFGTSRIRARRYFRNAVKRTARRTASARIQRALGKDVGLPGPDSPDLTKVLAFALEEEVRDEIRRQGLIDTGNLRGSFAAGPTLSEEKSKSRQNTTR